MNAALAVNGKPGERALTALQKKLADLWLEATFNGLDIPQHQLAKAAGYGGNTPEALRVIASKALNAPHVRAYLRQQARERMDEGGIEALATLKRLTTQAQSERVRGDIAYKVAVGTGMLQAEGQAGSGSVVLQLVFRHSDGHGLASVSERQAQVIDVQGEDAGERPPTKGTGRAKGGQQATGDHPRHPPKARAEGAGVKNPKRRPPSTPTHHSPSKTRGGGVGKSGGDAGGSSDFSGGAKSRGVKR